MQRRTSSRNQPKDSQGERFDQWRRASQLFGAPGTVNVAVYVGLVGALLGTVGLVADT